MEKNTMRRLRIALATAAVTILGVLGVAASPANASTTTVYGCSAGWVCLYKYGYALSPIIGSYYYYGYHNLSNVLGEHLILNNQTSDIHTGIAWAYPCFNYGGTNCFGGIYAADYGYQAASYNFTPINSIRLSPYYIL